MSEMSGEGTFRSRPTCRYGTKCRMLDEEHSKKYKHPPGHDPKAQRQPAKRKRKQEPRKKASEDEEPDSTSSKAKIQKTSDEEVAEKETAEVWSVADSKSDESSERVLVSSLLGDLKINPDEKELSSTDARVVIPQLFLTEMPEDFYEFFHFCKSLLPSDPLNAFKNLGLELVGPFDVFSKGFLQKRAESKEAFPRHWRFYYDPPEFQTILIASDSSGLHFGYWRDEPTEEPVFVAMNEAKLDCQIKPVARNIFGAVDTYLRDKVSTIDIFKRSAVQKLQQKLKKLVDEKGISLDKKTSSMQSRQKKVVAKTFHKAGVVVPYNKKTELGYRELSVTDKELQEILQKIEKAGSEELRKPLMSKLQEVVRLATIAADECDFGTCLELAHDLFASGNTHVQHLAARMFSTAYSLLERSEFTAIVKSHLKNRRKTLDLSVLE